MSTKLSAQQLLSKWYTAFKAWQTLNDFNRLTYVKGKNFPTIPPPQLPDSVKQHFGDSVKDMQYLAKLK